MAPSLRQRLSGKRQASPDPQNTLSEHDDSGGSATSLETKMSRSMQTEQQQPLAQEDMTTTPPPPDRKLRSSTEKTSRNVSPSQSLLDRYKNRVGKASVKTSFTSVESAEDRKTQKVGKDTMFSENFDDEALPIQADWVNVLATADNEENVPKPSRVYKGVEFEMMGKKGEAGKTPATTESDDGFSFERRTTRSQSRREQRADSHDSNFDHTGVATEGPIVPSKLTINKNGGYEMVRTPSPQASPSNAVRSPGQMAPTPSNSPRDLPATPRPFPARLVDRPKDTTPLTHTSPSPDPIVETPTFVSSHRSRASESLRSALSATPVVPPPFGPSVANGWTWASPLGSTSRPSEPWGWLKAWTCCKCAHLDPGNRDRPAQTMVEQKVCSRLECQHERCALGCRVMRDRRFDGPGVYVGA